ncbi:MAG: hypothetical protein U5L96_11085 [Owenweeksia sp.]|nr:hypothetical protein [Owenweeksia sp.]
MHTDFQDLFRGMEPKHLSAFLNRFKSSQMAVLTQLEKELCILVWLNFDNHEIAQLLSIELADVDLERERIREKLKIKFPSGIQGFMQQISGLSISASHSFYGIAFVF